MFRLTRLRALTLHIIPLHTMSFDIPLRWVYQHLSVSMYSLNTTILYIYLHRHSLNLTMSINTYYVFRYTLIMVYHHLSVSIYSLNTTIMYIYIHRHSLNLTMSITTYYVFFFRYALTMGISSLVVLFSQNLYIYFAQREVLNYLILFSMLYKRSIKLVMVYSPILLLNIQNI